MEGAQEGWRGQGTGPREGTMCRQREYEWMGRGEGGGDFWTLSSLESTQDKN